MKHTSVQMDRLSIAFIFSTLLGVILLLSACNKDNQPNPPENLSAKSPSFYSGDVIEKWMTLQIRLMKNSTGIPNQAFTRHYVYSGIAALESIAPGLPASATWTKKWNGLSGLPIASQGKEYFWPANVNAALARINRLMFPNASDVNKAAIDSLENAFNAEFLTSNPTSLIETSSDFGKEVATAVYNWSEIDGYKNAGGAYTPPVGPGLWVPTGTGNASTPYWGNNRPVIQGSIDNTVPSAPHSYSEDPSSPFFNMVKEVYDASLTLTNDQKAMAMFWRDVPGVTTPGHWLSILKQTIEQTNTSLGKAALAYALTGAAINDAAISCWKTKYQYNLLRPVTYIRNVMGHTDWTPYLINTPPHPEYSSAHAVLSTATAEMMETLFGDIDSFTDHTFDYLGFAPRTYSSFHQIGQEASYSRFYAGIHYKPSISVGVLQGKKIAENIFGATVNTK